MDNILHTYIRSYLFSKQESYKQRIRQEVQSYCRSQMYVTDNVCHKMRPKKCKLNNCTFPLLRSHFRPLCSVYQIPFNIFLCELGIKPRINAIYVLALQRSLIILVSPKLTCYSEKMMISYSYIRGFMPKLHKKS